MKAALRTLAILMVSLVVLPLFEIPLIDKDALLRLIMQVLFGAVILATLYSYVRKGSKTARVVLTGIAGLGVLLTAALIIVAIRVPALDAIYGVNMFARIAIVVLINTHPINTITRDLPAPKPRPLSESHEHDWQPHALLNDWLKCTACGEMHAESGTVALINRKN